MMLVNDLEVGRTLTSEELREVSGGLKWESGTKNDHVIDARGGKTTMGGITFTFDIEGNVSSINGTSTSGLS